MNVKHSLCLILLILLFLCGCSFKERDDIIVCGDESSLINFTEQDGVVHIMCRITLENTTDMDCVVRISGYSEEDVSTGLLRYPHLTGYNTEEESDLFLLEANERCEFLIDFQGEYAGNFLKSDRLIPDNIIVDVVE